jgi:outer membrane protein OmpA-like peptidoglycan-associated protein
MRRILFVAILMFAATACGRNQAAGPETGSESAAETIPEEEGTKKQDNEFQLRESDDAGQARGKLPSEIKATKTHAAMRLFVVNRDSGPIKGIVIKMTGPDGTSYFTDETDSLGYAEVLVPIGKKYAIEYLSLGRRNTMASVNVPEEPNQNIRLTLRYRRVRPAPPMLTPQPVTSQQRFVLDGIVFETGSATIQTESFPRLDRVVEYMTHKTRSRIHVSGHTDNVGNPRSNQELSEARAQSVRKYLMSHGIDGSRIEIVGFGEQFPIASNDAEEGRQQNRRIEVIEL